MGIPHDLLEVRGFNDPDLELTASQHWRQSSSVFARSPLTKTSPWVYTAKTQLKRAKSMPTGPQRNGRGVLEALKVAKGFLYSMIKWRLSAGMFSGLSLPPLPLHQFCDECMTHEAMKFQQYMSVLPLFRWRPVVICKFHLENSRLNQCPNTEHIRNLTVGICWRVELVAVMQAPPTSYLIGGRVFMRCIML